MQKIFSALTVAQCSDYEVMKGYILKSYELVPEAYRQKFRNYQKFGQQTCVEFAQQKQQFFDRWCSSMDISGNFEKLRQLILLEEFKNCMSTDVRTYLCEKSITDLGPAAITADEYLLTHKSFGKSHNVPRFESFGKSHNVPRFEHAKHDKSVGNFQVSNAKVELAKTDKPSKPNGISNNSLKCFYCHRKGHVISTCWELKIKGASKANQWYKPVGSIQYNQNVSVPETSELWFHSDSVCDKPVDSCSPRVISDGVSHGHVDVIIDDPCLDGYKNFMSEGKVSVPYESETVSPVTILRDTGASQSLWLKSVLPKLSDIPSKSCVLVKGFGCGTYVSVPLHTITMVSDLVSGDVSIGVVSQLPVEGIDMLLGNDLAGAKVIVEPVDSNDTLEYMFPSAFPSCVVTRSMTKKDDIDLNSTFLANDEILTSMSDNVSKHVVVKDIQVTICNL